MEQENKLKPLVARRANKQEVIQLLGTNYNLYAADKPYWQFLTNYLAKNPNLDDVRVRAAKWPVVMLYSTPYVMTWVFLDKEEAVVDFLVGAQ